MLPFLTKEFKRKKVEDRLNALLAEYKLPKDHHAVPVIKDHLERAVKYEGHAIILRYASYVFMTISILLLLKMFLHI